MLDPPAARRDGEDALDRAAVGQRRDEARGRSGIAIERDQEAAIAGDGNGLAVEGERARVAGRLPDERGTLLGRSTDGKIATDGRGGRLALCL